MWHEKFNQNLIRRKVCFYCVFPYKTALGSSWGGWPYICAHIQSCMLHQVCSLSCQNNLYTDYVHHSNSQERLSELSGLTLRACWFALPKWGSRHSHMQLPLLARWHPSPFRQFQAVRIFNKKKNKQNVFARGQSLGNDAKKSVEGSFTPWAANIGVTAPVCACSCR